MPEPISLLAFDYGLRNIGVAACSSTITVTELAPLRARHDSCGMTSSAPVSAATWWLQEARNSNPPGAVTAGRGDVDGMHGGEPLGRLHQRLALVVRVRGLRLGEQSGDLVMVDEPARHLETAFLMPLQPDL